MPDNTYPPFAGDTGGLTQPRTLQKWLDTSPQGGALRRTQSYVSLPVFNQAVTWRGYSEIIIAFNFAASNNFVWIDRTDLPSDGNYVLCVAWQKDGVVYRYKLCGPAGVFYFALADYTNQKIGKNFRLEVWSISAANVSETTARQMWTSVRGQVDYRFGVDFELVSVSTTVTDFQNIQTTVDLPYQTDLMFDFRADTNYDRTAGTWTSRTVDANVLTCSAPGQLPSTDARINNHTYLPLTQAKPWAGTLSNGQDAYNLFAIFRAEITASTGSVINIHAGGSPIFGIKLGASGSTNGTTVLTAESDLGDYTTITTQLSNNFYLVEVRFAFAHQYGLNDSVPKNSATGPGNFSQFVNQVSLAAGRGIDLVEFWAYGNQQNFNSPPDYYQLFKYISDRYGIGRIPLPFVFPANSTVPDNT